MRSNLTLAGINSRKIKCKYGHLLSGDNLYVYEGIRKSNGHQQKLRGCKICRMNIANKNRKVI